MFTKYIKSLNKADCPVVLSVTDTTTLDTRSETLDTRVETIIQRNNNVREENDIYVRAREIYLRARRQRHRLVRAASIF